MQSIRSTELMIRHESEPEILPERRRSPCRTCIWNQIPVNTFCGCACELQAEFIGFDPERDRRLPDSDGRFSPYSHSFPFCALPMGACNEYCRTLAMRRSPIN